jgi:negative regulator of sigma-B (phosphoserine phosphatase)
MDAAIVTEDPGILSSLAEWGVAGRAIAGETVSGDAHVLAAFSNGFLAAVVDGLGHGPQAMAAAIRATAALRKHPGGPVEELMRRCHEELRRMRGAVLSLASFSTDNTMMTWLGVGNVEGVLFRAVATAKGKRESLLLRGGVVGYQLPPLRAATLPVFFGDTLVLATDGISSGFRERSPLGLHPQDYADEILSRWGKHSDDALVLAVRYLGGRS